MKRLSSILAIFLVVSAVAVVAISAGTPGDGNSTIQNDTVIVEPTPGDTASNQSDVTNGTNATVPLTDSNSVYISVLDVGAPGGTANQEYVKIANKGTTAVSLKDWTIKDAGTEHTYLFPSYTLNAKSTVTLRSGSGTNTADTLYWNKWSFIWNNNGDTAYLYNSQGNLVSSRGTSETNGTNVTNGTNDTNATVPPKPSPGTIIPAPTTPIKVVDKTSATVPPKTIPVKLTIPQTNDGVQITALHPLSGGVEYVSITNFNDFTAHLEGYKIHEMQCNNTIVFQDVKIKPGHTLKVYTGSHPDGPDVVGTHKLHHIYNQHDAVELICACDNVIYTFKQ